MRYTPRVAQAAIKRLLNVFPVIGITGPRQSGKSTLLQHLFKDYRYVTFDDVTQISRYEDDPIGFINHYSEKVIFDEVQLVPELFSSIKLVVDKNRSKYGNFILTGSSQFAFLKSASESLAGRIGLLSLLPFQTREIPKALLETSIFNGSYPELVLRNYQESSLWYASYIDTYLNKDLRTLAEVGDMRDFRRLIQLLAANIAQTVDYSEYAKQLGVSSPTIKRWISILEASYIIFLLPPYYKNYGKRITKRPKLYFFDTGLVSFLTGIKTFDQYNNGPLGGPLFENYVISELYKKELHTLGEGELFFLRTQDQAEIDLIIDRKTTRELYEIKKNASFKPNMIRHLKSFKQEGDHASLIYQGDDESYQGIFLCNYLKNLSH